MTCEDVTISEPTGQPSLVVSYDALILARLGWTASIAALALATVGLNKPDASGFGIGAVLVFVEPFVRGRNRGHLRVGGLPSPPPAAQREARRLTIGRMFFDEITIWLVGGALLGFVSILQPLAAVFGGGALGLAAASIHQLRRVTFAEKRAGVRVFVAVRPPWYRIRREDGRWYETSTPTLLATKR